MPEPRRVEFGGKIQEFPADATDAEISAALNAIPSSNAASVPQAKTWTDSAGPAIRGMATIAGRNVPEMAANAAMELATNPNVPKVGAAIGRVVGAVAPIVGGAAEGPMGALLGVSQAAKGSWLGGRTGWFSGKLAQSVAAPVANVLESVAPYAQSLAHLGGAQSLLDLAQVAEPNRQDIGTLGVSVGTPRSDAEKTAHPALLNMLAGKVQEGIQALMHYGLSREDAVKAIGDQTAPVENHGNDPSWLRSDGTAKGNGFLGVLKRPDGKVSSEISVGVNIGGKEVDIPTLVPTLTAAEKNWLLTNDVSDPSRIPKAIIQKAVDFARPRIAAGKSPFAGPGESPR